MKYVGTGIYICIYVDGNYTVRSNSLFATNYKSIETKNLIQIYYIEIIDEINRSVALYHQYSLW